MRIAYLFQSSAIRFDEARAVQLHMLQAAVKDEKVNLGLDEVMAAGINLETGTVDLSVPTASAEHVQAVLDKARFSSASVGAVSVPKAEFSVHEEERGVGGVPTPMAGTGANATLNAPGTGGSMRST